MHMQTGGSLLDGLMALFIFSSIILFRNSYIDFFIVNMFSKSELKCILIIIIIFYT